MINIQLASEEWVEEQFGGGTGGSTGNTNSVTDVTYNELTSLINTNNLTIGGQYLITDYQTVHKIPNTTDINSGMTEPLLVTASGVNKLKPEAYSSLFPQDIIYYNYYSDQTMVIGCTKGYIYRRIDTAQNNDIPFDFRNVKFRRWQINVSEVWNSGTTYNRNNVVLSGNTNNILYVSIVSGNTGNQLSNTNYWNTFYMISNKSYVSTTSVGYQFNALYLPCSTGYTDYNMWSNWNDYNTSFNNIIDKQFLIPMSNIYGSDMITYSNNVIFGYQFNNNKIGSYFFNNTIFNSFSFNKIGSYFFNNLIGFGFNNNSIKNNFSDNLLDDFFQNNSIDDYFDSNIIGINFRFNTIGGMINWNTILNNFQYNTIGNAFQNNSIGSLFNNNTIFGNFYYNTIGSNFQNNTIENVFTFNNIIMYFQNNSIESYFNSNTIGSNFQYNTIGSYFNSNTIGSNFTMNNVCDYFNFDHSGLNFTSSTHVYNQYSKDLFVNSSGQRKLIYDKVTIVDATA